MAAAPDRRDRARRVELGAGVTSCCARKAYWGRYVQVAWWQLDDATAVAVGDGVGNGRIDALTPTVARKILGEQRVDNGAIQAIYICGCRLKVVGLQSGASGREQIFLKLRQEQSWP